MEPWTGIITASAAILGMIVPKLVDFFLGIAKEKRDFKKFRRERVYVEIEELKDLVGKVYELSANWKGYDWKVEDYNKAFHNDHELIGKYTKYPEVASAARDAIQWCKIVAFSEKKSGNDLIDHKKELQRKHREFLQACDKFLDQLS